MEHTLFILEGIWKMNTDNPISENKVKMACVICGFDRSVDRCHIIPKKIVRGIRGFEKMQSYDGNHIIYLCKNHHFLFDLARLNENEWKILRKNIPRRTYQKIEMILNSDLKGMRKANPIQVRKQSSLIERWKDRLFYGLGFERIK